MEDENRNQIQIKQKFQFEFDLRDTTEFKSNPDPISTLYRADTEKFDFLNFDQLTKISHDSGFRLPFNSDFESHLSRNGLYYYYYI